ncbi:hypothetical protein RXV86_12305 [Alisedimentitalea sp. MJ-SS2]|uniref:hypothetical protein n=1 Tax=Aliisedimentitalea sp. MJ-SS2 TaxID=3049795 RepID=UPI00290976D5|nr:hypothetical protein [Alisedimentitalea sp. MJ-SS2]MDU8928171.1 hypothetical protein [Alisedimentitalea sp. MJ-SS2]
MATQGDAPPWLYDHKAECARGGARLICTEGQVTHQPTDRTVENLTTWEFDLAKMSWEFIETKPFQRWILLREDESYNDLWGIEQVARANRSSRKSTIAERYRTEFEERGLIVDVELFEGRFSPPIPHRKIEPDTASEDHKTHRILIDDVVVRFTEDRHEIVVTVEGELPMKTLEALEQHGLRTYSTLEGVPYKSVRL